MEPAAPSLLHHHSLALEPPFLIDCGLVLPPLVSSLVYVVFCVIYIDVCCGWGCRVVLLLVVVVVVLVLVVVVDLVVDLVVIIVVVVVIVDFIVL